jgi:hypothetical protein
MMQAAVNPMQGTWRGLNSQADIGGAEAAASAAYARGVAAGVAFARGFAVGATGGGKKSGSAPNFNRGGKDEKASLSGAGAEQQTCKWFDRGTCKFGGECRYLHTSQTTSRSQDAQLSGSGGPQTAPHAGNLVAHGTRISLEGALMKPITWGEHSSTGECQIFWCDQRAFKENAAALKEQLETEIGVAVKTYRTADMCRRLLRKKTHWSGNSFSRIFLISWANAQALVPYLAEEAALAHLVVVLCDTCGSKGCSKAELWAKDYPIVNTVATTWPQALEVLKEWKRTGAS